MPVILAAFAAGMWTTSSANDKIDQPERFVTRIEPGDNLVSWTEQVSPVETLFERLPQIQHVWAWDPAWQSWRLASPHMPRRLWTLSVLSPGMGLRIRFAGQRPIDWERPRRPAQGTVELKPGWNFVAWLGRDEAPLNRVALGIGRSLLHLGLRSHGSHDFTVFETAPTDLATASRSLPFGEPLWVNVVRTVNWLQPTGILPEIIFAGIVSTERKQEAIDAMKATLDFHYKPFRSRSRL